MKAIILKGFGGVENLVRAELPPPEIDDNEVLINVKAFAINPVDVKTRLGKGLAGMLKDFDPIILGWDVSGVVTGTGKKVSSFKPGDEVFGMIKFPGHGKAYSEFAAAPESHLALKPSNISHQEAAAACLAALTAWQVLKDKAGIKKGDNILIHSAAGGVGHYAVQMAKYLGASVAGTASWENKEFVMNLGASVHIDYEKHRFEEILHEMDFVMDLVGGEYTERSLKVLKKGGTIINIPSGVTEKLEERAREMGVKGYNFLVKSNGENMKEIARLLENGAVKSFIMKAYPFDEIQAAHLQMETRKTRGKLVVTVD